MKKGLTLLVTLLFSLIFTTNIGASTRQLVIIEEVTRTLN